MSEIFINNARSCAITGHRVLPKNFNFNKLKSVFNKLIDDGFNTFLIGMALGFDTACFNVLEQIKTKKDIKLIACIPCKNQADKFNKAQREEYFRMLSVADEKIYIREEYDNKCMQERNEYMVDNCSVLVAYLTRERGGTVNTVKYARKKGVTVLNLGDLL